MDIFPKSLFAANGNVFILGPDASPGGTAGQCLKWPWPPSGTKSRPSWLGPPPSVAMGSLQELVFKGLVLPITSCASGQGGFYKWRRMHSPNRDWGVQGSRWALSSHPRGLHIEHLQAGPAGKGPPRTPSRACRKAFLRTRPSQRPASARAPPQNYSTHRDYEPGGCPGLQGQLRCGVWARRSCTPWLTVLCGRFWWEPHVARQEVLTGTSLGGPCTSPAARPEGTPC